MRYRDLLRNIDSVEQKLDNVILYIDFLPTKKPIIFLKDGSLLILFRLDGLDYEGLSEEKREEAAHCARTALELLPDEGFGFMVSNLLIRDTPKPIPLIANPDAPPLIQFVQGKKQVFWNELISKSFANGILCGLRYFPQRVPPPWGTLVQDKKRFTFYVNEIKEAAEKLEQGFLALSSGLDRFGFREMTREESFSALYELINYSDAPVYRKDLSLIAQLTHSQYQFHDDYLVINDTEYVSIVGVRVPPPSSVAMYLRRFYELGFPLILRQSIGFASKEKLKKEQDFNLPIAMALSTVDPKNLNYVEEVRDFRTRLENDELPIWWHFSVTVRAKDKDTLRVRRSEVITLLKEIGSFGITERRNLKAAFFSTLPGHDRLYIRRAPLTTANAGDFLSAYVLYAGDTNPVDYLEDRLRGVFSYNPFTRREKAHHRAICGPTAGGKSFFVIKDLIAHLIVNPMIWVVDLSASYLNLFELLQEEMPTETAIMQVSRENSSFAFNPFLMDNPQEEVSEQQFEFCMGFLKLMAGKELSGNPTNELAMREGLKEFFNSYRTLLKNQREPEPIPPLDLLAGILGSQSRDSGLSAAFQLWTEGRRGALFNTGRDSLTKARYCYFDLRDLDDEPELMTAIVYVIFSKVYRDIADESLRPIQKRFVLDEAHRYIADPAFSFWINLLARTGRHWNIMLDLITQSINDLQSNAILTNLKQAFMFPGQKNIEDSFARMQLTDYHIEQYKQLNPARYEALYWSDGGLRRVLRSVADPYTYWLATTDAGERDMKRRMKEHFGNIRDAIEELVFLTEGCHNIEQRILKLQKFFKESRLAAATVSD